MVPATVASSKSGVQNHMYDNVKRNNETSDLSLSEQSSFTTSPQTERKDHQQQQQQQQQQHEQHRQHPAVVGQSNGSLDSRSESPSKSSSVVPVLPPKSLKHVPNMVPKSPRLLNRTKGPPPPVKEKPKYNPFIVPKGSQMKETSPTLSDLAMRDALASPLPPKSPLPGHRDWSTNFESRYGIFFVKIKISQKNHKLHIYKSYYSYDKYGSLGRKESMGRYRKYQPSNSTSAVGMSMGSPRLVARNMSFQMAKEIPSDPIRESPSYANTHHVHNMSRPSPILGRRAIGPPQPSPNLHRRQTSELLKQEVIYLQNEYKYFFILFKNNLNIFCLYVYSRFHTPNNSPQYPIPPATMLEAVTTIVQLWQQ